MPAQVRIQVLQRNLDLLIERVTQTELRRRAENVIREIQQLAPRSDGTNSYTNGVPGAANGGRLADSFRIGTTTQRGKTVLRIFSNAKNSRGQFYAGMVAKGTAAHTITAKNRANLAFRWISQGVFVITPQVSHPGTAPNDYIRRGLAIGFHK